MRQHFDRSVERLVARGLSADEARIEARREFGNVTLIEHASREARGMRWAESVGADVKYAWRYFARNKVTAALIVSVLALGIGANIVIFSLLRAEFYRPPMGVPEDASQVRIAGLQRATRTARWSETEFSSREVQELAARRETFRDVVAWIAHDVVLDAGDSTRECGYGTILGRSGSALESTMARRSLRCASIFSRGTPSWIHGGAG